MLADMGDHGDSCGWAWLVCLTSCITAFFEAGTVKALGVLLPVLREQFETQTWVIGLIISLVPGVGSLSCLLAGALSKPFSARYTVMLFNLSSSIGLVIGSISSSVPMLSVCFVVHGSAIGANAILNGELALYFDDEYFSVVNSIYRAGASFGIIILPLLTQFLFDVYGWRGCMLIIAGLSFHCIISGAVLRTNQFRSHPSSTNSTNDDQEYIKTVTTNDESGQNAKSSSNLIAMLSYYLDLDLFYDRNFVARLVYIFGDGYCVTGWLIYRVPFAIENDISPYKAASLATVGGIGNLLSKGAFPFLVKVVSSEHILYSTAIACCLAFAFYSIVSAYHAYIGFMLCSVVFGVGTGLGDLANSQIAKETIDTNKMTNVFVWLYIIWGVGSVTSGFLSGWIYDQTGSYILSFLILSAVALLSVSPQPFVENKPRPGRSQYSAI